MLVNPSVQQPSSYQTAQPAPAQSEVGREDVVRSDLPPVEQSSESSAGTNQQLQNNDQRFQQELVEQKASDASRQQADTANQQTEETAIEARVAQEKAAEEQAIEQQRQQDDAIIQQLKARDREVRLHEAAHAAVGGKYAGSPTYGFERGPDGVNYAVSGEVSISISKIPGDPEATLEKARVVRAAATAPAEPSAQDRRVASEATQLETEARAEIQAQKIATEQQRKERIDEAREESVEEDAANDELVAEEVEVEAQEVSIEVSTPEVGANQQAQGSDDNEDQDSDEPKPTAKDQLEEILLGSETVPQSLNQSGLVDAQNPYGKSGFIEYIV